MPIYDIICKDCGKENEVLCKNYESISCPDCEKGDSVEVKLFQPSSFRLKGRGWYETFCKTSDTQKNVYRKD